MCGRFTQTVNMKKAARELKIPSSGIPELKPRYNIAPSQSVACLVQEEGSEPGIQLFRWGLIPSWAKDPAIGHRMINARLESLAEKPSFRGPLRKNRCLVLADGFYEWKKEEAGKRPYYIRLKSRNVFTFAGLWAEWPDPSGPPVRSCTIITGPANALIAPLHDRMPVILGPERRSDWLRPAGQPPEKILPLLKPYPPDEMELYPVSSLVNSPKNDVPECIRKA